MSKTPPAKKTIPTWVNFLIGGASGMIAICFVQPNDLIKTRMQLAVKKDKSLTYVTMAKRIVANEGFKGLYKGLTASLFRQFTYTTGRLGTFNTIFDYYKTNYGTPNMGAKLILGSIAGGCGGFMGNPAEVCLIRMTADGRLPPEKRRNYKSVFNALSRIVSEEGVLTLWRGVGATVTRAMVVNGAQLGTYAQARELLLKSMKDGIGLHFLASMISGLVTSAASLPVDIVKTRVQNAANGTSQITVLKNIITKEGVFSLWSGFLPTYLKIGPHTVITFIIMEQFNKLYLRMAYP